MNATQARSGALLEMQAKRLELLAARLEEVRRRLPHLSQLVWRGPAAIIYGVALEHLMTEFARAHQQLALAASASRRAAALVMATTNG
ncbi:MAG: hypothetical protein V4479_04330 [Actinomycetota bacterium]